MYFKSFNDDSCVFDPFVVSPSSPPLIWFALWNTCSATVCMRASVRGPSKNQISFLTKASCYFMEIIVKNWKRQIRPYSPVQAFDDKKHSKVCSREILVNRSHCNVYKSWRHLSIMTRWNKALKILFHELPEWNCLKRSLSHCPGFVNICGMKVERHVL